VVLNKKGKKHDGNDVQNVSAERLRQDEDRHGARAGSHIMPHQLCYFLL